jgi:hypothetical protein
MTDCKERWIRDVCALGDYGSDWSLRVRQIKPESLPSLLAAFLAFFACGAMAAYYHVGPRANAFGIAAILFAAWAYVISRK